MSESPEIINPSPAPEDEFAEFRPVIRGLARKIVRYGLTTPAVILFEAERPLNWIAGQALHVANPTLSFFTEFFALATAEDLDKFARFLEDRRSFDVLVEEIERQSALKDKLNKLEGRSVAPKVSPMHSKELS